MSFADEIRARGESNTVWLFARLIEDGVVSQEKLATLLADNYHSLLTRLLDRNGVDAMGEVQNVPTEFTLLRRLRDIDLSVDALLTGIVLAAGDNNIGNVDVLTTAITKTIQTELLAITKVAANAQQKSSELDLTNMKKVAIMIDHGRTATTAFVVAGTEYRIEVSQKATGDDTWRMIASAVCGITAATAITADGNEAAGSTLIEIGANTPVVNDIVFWENTTLSESEWGKVVAIVAGTSFTLLDGLTNLQRAAQLIYNKGEQYVFNLDVEPFTRLRVIVNNNNGTTNAEIASRVAAINQE